MDKPRCAPQKSSSDNESNNVTSVRTEGLASSHKMSLEKLGRMSDSRSSFGNRSRPFTPKSAGRGTMNPKSKLPKFHQKPEVKSLEETITLKSNPKAFKSNSEVPQNYPSVGEYRKRLYKGLNSSVTQVQQLEDEMPFHKSLDSSKFAKSSYQNNDSNPNVKSKRSISPKKGSKKPSYFLQYGSGHSEQADEDNGQLLEQLMTDIIAKIHSYESNYYRRFWLSTCSSSNFNPRSKEARPGFDQCDDHVVPPSELRVHIASLREDMAKMDACSSYRLACLEQLMKLNRLLQYTDGFVRVKDLKRKGISFVRRGSMSRNCPDSSESSLFKVCQGDGSISEKLRKQKLSSSDNGSFSGRIFCSRPKSAKKQQTCQSKTSSMPAFGHPKLGSKSKEKVKCGHNSNTEMYSGQIKKEFHLPPIIVENKDSGKMQEISSNEDTVSHQIDEICPKVSTESCVTYDGRQIISTKIPVEQEVASTNTKTVACKISKKISEAGTQTNDSLVYLTGKSEDDLNRYVTGGGNIKNMGKRQLLMALKSLVDTPYYKIDSVIYRLKKELEDVDFKQENKLTGTNDMLEPQANLKEPEKRTKDESEISDASSVSKCSPSKVTGGILQKSTSTITTLAKHVIDDFLFEKDKPRHSMVKLVTSKSGALKTGTETCIIEEGQHFLHSARKDSDALSYSTIEYHQQPSTKKDDTSSSSSSSSDLRKRPSKASCNFRQQKGEIYYMYLRDDGSTYFSMLSPLEKGEVSYGTYLGSYLRTDDNKMEVVSGPCSLPKQSPPMTEKDFGLTNSIHSDSSMPQATENLTESNYYKYRRKDGSSFLTTLSPTAWGPTCPHRFIKAYRETKSGVMLPLRTNSTSALESIKEESTYPMTDFVQENLDFIVTSHNPTDDLKMSHPLFSNKKSGSTYEATSTAEHTIDFPGVENKSTQYSVDTSTSFNHQCNQILAETHKAETLNSVGAICSAGQINSSEPTYSAKVTRSGIFDVLEDSQISSEQDRESLNNGSQENSILPSKLEEISRFKYDCLLSEKPIVKEKEMSSIVHTENKHCAKTLKQIALPDSVRCKLKNSLEKSQNKDITDTRKSVPLHMESQKELCDSSTSSRHSMIEDKISAIETRTQPNFNDGNTEIQNPLSQDGDSEEDPCTVLNACQMNGEKCLSVLKTDNGNSIAKEVEYAPVESFSEGSERSSRGDEIECEVYSDKDVTEKCLVQCLKQAHNLEEKNSLVLLSQHSLQSDEFTEDEENVNKVKKYMDDMISNAKTCKREISDKNVDEEQTCMVQKLPATNENTLPLLQEHEDDLQERQKKQLKIFVKSDGNTRKFLSHMEDKSNDRGTKMNNSKGESHSHYCESSGRKSCSERIEMWLYHDFPLESKRKESIRHTLPQFIEVVSNSADESSVSYTEEIEKDQEPRMAKITDFETNAIEYSTKRESSGSSKSSRHNTKIISTSNYDKEKISDLYPESCETDMKSEDQSSKKFGDHRFKELQQGNSTRRKDISIDVEENIGQISDPRITYDRESIKSARYDMGRITRSKRSQLLHQQATDNHKLMSPQQQSTASEETRINGNDTTSLISKSQETPSQKINNLLGSDRNDVQQESVVQEGQKSIVQPQMIKINDKLEFNHDQESKTSVKEGTVEHHENNKSNGERHKEGLKEIFLSQANKSRKSTPTPQMQVSGSASQSCEQEGKSRMIKRLTQLPVLPHKQIVSTEQNESAILLGSSCSRKFLHHEHKTRSDYALQSKSGETQKINSSSKSLEEFSEVKEIHKYPHDSKQNDSSMSTTVNIDKKHELKKENDSDKRNKYGRSSSWDASKQTMVPSERNHNNYTKTTDSRTSPSEHSEGKKISV